MTPPTAKRRYVSSDAFRYVVLAALAHREADGMSKGELAWETRANHYAVTKAVGALVDQGLAKVSGSADAGYTIRLTGQGRAFMAKHQDLVRTHVQDIVERVFRFGRIPAWARAEPLGTPPGRGTPT